MPRRLCNVTLLAAAGRAGTKKIRSKTRSRVLDPGERLNHVTWMAEFLGLVLDLHLSNYIFVGSMVVSDDYLHGVDADGTELVLSSIAVVGDLSILPCCKSPLHASLKLSL